MNIELKKRLLAYVKSHNDGTDEAKELIKKMETEVSYADCNIYSVCQDDLAYLSEDRRDDLEEHFGKPLDRFTAEDCQEIADEIAENESDSFSEVLDNAVSTMTE